MFKNSVTIYWYQTTHFWDMIKGVTKGMEDGKPVALEYSSRTNGVEGT